ncbi:MAG: CRTAC1 family protein [Planctomycetes bacterium]|nr:CRTAC1 family protein [Planctomycetota bacterium]
MDALKILFCLSMFLTFAKEARTALSFVNVSSEVGLPEEQNAPFVRNTFVDLDEDGFLDIVSHVGGDINCERRIAVFMNVEGDGGRRRFIEDDPDYAHGLNLAPGLRGHLRRSNFCIFADVDNDGDVDCFSAAYSDHEFPRENPLVQLNRRRAGTTELFALTNRAGEALNALDDIGQRSRVFLNDGRGRFKAAPDSDLQRYRETTCAATFLDYDADGWLDLFTGNWYRHYGADVECYPSRLYKGRGDGTFTEVTEEAGMGQVPEPALDNSARPVYGSVAVDYNNDGWQDLIACSYGRQWNRLWRNNADGTFTDVGIETQIAGDPIEHGRYPAGIDREAEDPFRANGNTFGAAVADYNRDGLMDVFLSEITHWWAGDSSDRSSLLTNLGLDDEYAFERNPDAMPRTHETDAWNQGDLNASWGDFDNDGELDLMLGSSDYPDDQFLRIFRQRQGGAFEDATAETGIALRNPTGFSVGDYDNDGDLDVIVGNSHTRLTPEQRAENPLGLNLLENRSEGGNWVQIKLDFASWNTSRRTEPELHLPTTGTRLEIITDAGLFIQAPRAGEGHCGGSNPATLHFGLGDATEIRALALTSGWKQFSHSAYGEMYDVNRIARLRLIPGTDGGMELQ